MNAKTDFVIIGGGIIGLTIARELKTRKPNSSIILLEKESRLGLHASGRNSGVLHSGIFYAEDSVKARVCMTGARELAAYCEENRLPIKRVGKVIVPARQEDGKTLEMLYERAKRIGIHAILLDEKELKGVEPHAFSATGKSLHLPDVPVVDPLRVVEKLGEELESKGVEIRFQQEIQHVDLFSSFITSNGEEISYGHLFNCAGLHADKMAHLFSLGKKFAIVPFKGLYFRIDPNSGLQVNGLIYAVPDLNMPFLGIHFMRNVNDEIYAGPTVVPTFGRENYTGFENLHFSEGAAILLGLLGLYGSNRKGFRQYVHREGLRFLKRYFYKGARSLVPDLKIEHLLPCDKVGIRAQLVEIRKNELVMDFLIDRDDRSTHILNAVSPAFTSSFGFAKLVLDQVGIM